MQPPQTPRILRMARMVRWARRHLLVGALMFILTLVFFHQLLLTERILARGDAYNYFYPYWDARNAAFRAGELPLWTTGLFMGAPLLANPQLGSFYPPNWLTAPLDGPAAIKISILLHLVLAGSGVVLLYRSAVSRRWVPAVGAGILFAFGGHLGAHVEQINQLQGLAWMPLLFALYHRSLCAESGGRAALLLAFAWALQIFSGHTQTVFISGLGLALYGAAWGWQRRGIRQMVRALLLLAGGGALALLLALPQLLPSLELMGMSNRGGGFNPQQATAFSLPPNLLGRALLPGYEGQLFGEYVAYLGVLGLGLALWGLAARSGGAKWRWALLAAAGLGLALGRFNPLYLLLAELPGFDLFRVPARFLALFGLAMALLAGMGIEALPRAESLGQRRRALCIAALLALLILLTRFVLQPDPRDIYGSAALGGLSLGLWGAALLGLLGLLWARHRWLPALSVGLLGLELFLAALGMPYNDLSPPDVYLGQRFTISQLLAYQGQELPPGRTLSVSQLYFDPGDIAALRARFGGLGMDAAAQFHALDAVKKQEMLMPNLPLTWGLETVDGFGGGIMPTRYYSQFTSLLLPAGSPRAVDGRLGERLANPACRGACLPALRWLQQTDTRYLITDKVYDVWHGGIAYDTALARYWRDAVPAVLADAADANYDEVRILHSAPLANAAAAERIQDGLLLTRTDWAALRGLLATEHSIIAVTLVNSRAESDFRQLQPPPLERVLSSDVKIYRLPEGSGRAYLAAEVQILPDTWQGHEDALRALQAGAGTVIHRGLTNQRSDEDDAARTAQAGGGAGSHHETGGRVEFVEYSAARVVLEVDAARDAYLILKDAWYPGWQAEVNGSPVEVLRANVMFRAVAVAAGESRVVLRFEPLLWRAALYGGGGVWLAVLGLLSAGAFRRRRAADANRRGGGVPRG